MSEGVQSFRDLVVWRKAMDMAVRLRYVRPTEVALAQSLVGEVGRMLTALGNRLRHASA